MPFRTRLRRRIVTSAPVREIIDRSKDVAVPGFGATSLYELWRPFWRQLGRASLPERASAISFNVFMAIPPTLLFLFTLIPYLPISGQFVKEMFDLIRSIVPGEENNRVVIQFLNDFLQQPRTGLLSFGLLLAVVFSSNAMMGILRSFDKSYQGYKKRSGLKRRGRAMQLSLVQLLFFFITLGLLIAHGQVLRFLGVTNPVLVFIVHNFRWVIIMLLVFYSICMIYRWGPSFENRWPLVTPGAVVSTLLLALATSLVSFWAQNFSNYNKLYGSISAVFILMTLIFVSSLVVLLGFELNVTLMTLEREENHRVETTEE